jgi:hypothetical protein
MNNIVSCWNNEGKMTNFNVNASYILPVAGWGGGGLTN